MHLPDDFGLSPVRTLAHVGDATPSPLHQHFWNTWHAAVFGAPTRLVSVAGLSGDPSDATMDHQFESLGQARIGCRLIMPPKGVKLTGGVVMLHGYEAPPNLGEECQNRASMAARGVAVLCVRVRGYPGSRRDVPERSDDQRGYVAQGLEQFGGKVDQLMHWSIPRAVADVVNACRALREHLGGNVPIGLSGVSFGGGLAVIAAAQLSGKEDLSRIAIGLPSLGDWRWRLGRPAVPATSGRHIFDAINAMTKGHAEREAQLMDAIRVCDALVHASKVRCPALAMLALRDEAVPAPTAAAIFNALGGDPGRKWRFVVPAGHHDAGLRNARRQALFERCVTDFMDLSREPFETMRPWESVLASGEKLPEGVTP